MADEADRANDIYEDHRAVHVRTITRALEQKNTSFECEDCPGEIEPARRAAMPSARRCIQCQEAFEKYRRIHRS